MGIVHLDLKSQCSVLLSLGFTLVHAFSEHPGASHVTGIAWSLGHSDEQNSLRNLCLPRTCTEGVMVEDNPISE